MNCVNEKINRTRGEKQPELQRSNKGTQHYTLERNRMPQGNNNVLMSTLPCMAVSCEGPVKLDSP